MDTKLNLFATFSDEDGEVVERASSIRVRDAPAHEAIIHEGDDPDHIKLVLSGWACRYKQLEDRRCEILALFSPGDLCDLKILILKAMDHSIAGVTPVRIAETPRDMMVDMADNGSRLAGSLVVGDGLGSNRTRVDRQPWPAYRHRKGRSSILQAINPRAGGGLTKEDSCEMPLTHGDLGDTTGLSTVHMNRSLQELRMKSLIVLKGRAAGVNDIDLVKSAFGSLRKSWKILKTDAP